MPVTACDLLYERVLPFYEALRVQVGAILTDQGRKFCGRDGSHPYPRYFTLRHISGQPSAVEPKELTIEFTKPPSECVVAQTGMSLQQSIFELVCMTCHRAVRN